MKGVAWRVALLVGLLALAAAVVFVLLAVWGGDGRWGGTAALAAFVGIVLTCTATIALDL